VIRKSAIVSVGLLLALLPGWRPALGSEAKTQKAFPGATTTRDITVVDDIETTIVEEHEVIGSPKGSPVWFSPDGNHFIILVKKGNVRRDTNDESMLLYRTTDALHSPNPQVLATMSSSSNREAIRGLKWISDDAIAFLGDMPGKAPQVYTINIRTKQIEQLTNESKVISAFDVSQDAKEIIYAADLPLSTGLDEKQKRNGFVNITDQRLALLTRGDYIHETFKSQLYSIKRGHAPLPLHQVWLPPGDALWLSPDGNHALAFVTLSGSDLKKEWTEYRFGATDEHLRSFFDSSTGGFGATPFEQYQLIDLKTGSYGPLLDTPFFEHGRGPVVAWKADGQSVQIEDVYLPLDVSNLKEREARRTTRYDVEVNIPSRMYRILSKEELHPKETTQPSVKITLEQDVNTPPKIQVLDLQTNVEKTLLDPNPQFASLKFGRVENIQWKVSGDYTVAGGLYLPPDFIEGRKYPLVIQTHGYRPEWFTMDGKVDWNSGFSARALAAKGLMVLQMYYFPDQKDADNVPRDKRFGSNLNQAWKQFETRAYEGVIDSLDKRGMIDRDRIGIMGFSRTVSYTGYALTHSTYHFAAALEVDGIDASYFSYIAYAGPGIFSADSEALNGGGPPWGDSFTGWKQESPGFNLDKIQTPIRLECHARLLGDDPGGGVMSEWEWFIGLSRLNKPVDFIVLPEASHMVAMPHERIVSQQGAVDWFRFWLQGYERPNPEDPDQYKRWEHLRELRDADDKAAEAPVTSPSMPN
jgi:dipeptidyl aminopeptidase/acylaminoacyl peptidase